MHTSCIVVANQNILFGFALSDGCHACQTRHIVSNDDVCIHLSNGGVCIHLNSDGVSTFK